MKRVPQFLFAFLFLTFCVQAASSWKETRTILFSSSLGENQYLLRPNESFCRAVEFKPATIPTRKFLRVIGNLRMPAPFAARGEEMFRRAEFLIDDNLDSIIRKKDRYSLYFKGENDDFERHAYYRISGKELKSGELTVVVPVVKKQNLEVASTGDFGVEIELFYQKPGRAADDIYDEPDSLLYMPILAGSGNYQEVSQTFQLPEHVACLFLRVGGRRFSGECWVEAPRLMQNKKLVASIPFTKFADRPDTYNYWVGCNLSTCSWPMWQLEFNGKTLFRGNVFDRASNVTDFYILLPDSIQGNGDLRLTLLKEPHRTAYPYELRGLELIEETARDFEVISVPKFVTKNQSFGLLIETNRPDVSLQVTAQGAVSPAVQTCRFEKSGLHVVELRAEAAGNSASLTISDGERTEQVEIQQIIDKASEQIYLSSGDEIYIDKQYTPYDYFFKWYISNRIGNWYQFRPSYQWSGFRIADPAFVRHYTGLLNQLKMPYAWQVEGRTLAGSRINPSLETLASPMFRGKQAHENDGGYYYWQHFLYQGLFSDMAARNRPYGGIFAKHRPIYTDHGVFIHYDPEGVTDMADGARKLVANFRYSKGESSRHTGPSTLFRYLYQAGYSWLGAEQMYGPEEIILSSLRGASRAYSRPHYGSLHAMQWGSGPFTDPKHALRLYMSLAVAYMHGSSHMNTEEALWTDEYMNDRYSVSGKEHLFAQHQMLDFVETHSRRGELKSNIAVIQGRNDAWKSFGRGSLWSQKGEKWKFNQACESFDLLKVFYPENIVNGCGPEGWFTSTPYGTIDLLPIEAPQDVLNQYKALIFLGWNSYEKDDFLRIRDFVFNGGALLLAAAHLNVELQPDRPTCFPADDAIIREMLGNNYQQLTGRTEISYGKGRIIYFPQKTYPIALKEDYTAAMRQIATETVEPEDSKGWIKTTASVGFTVWDTPERRTVYLLNTDWKSDREQQAATFTYQGKDFPIEVRRYHIETIHCAEGLAVMPASNTTDVLSIQKEEAGWKVKIQNTEHDTLRFLNAVTGKVESFSFPEAGIHEMFIYL